VIEIGETFLRPVVSFALAILRALLWVGWDFGFQIVGWSIGWLVCRALTLGKFPAAAFNEVDNVDFWVALFIEIVGLAVLSAVIFVISGYAT